MFQVRVHGRGGQGVAATAELLSVAAFNDGRYALAFRGYRSVRNGIPVAAFCRIDDKAIRTREPVARPDALIVEDPSLLRQDEVLAGLGPEGYLVINSSLGLGELGLIGRIGQLCRDRMLVIPATRLAFAHLGRPLPGAPLLGGLAALTSQVDLEQVAAALHGRFSRRIADANEAAAREGYAFARAEREALASA